MAEKDKALELAGRLREQAKQGDPIAKAAVDLVGTIIADLKDGLVTAEGDDMLRMQGAARQFGKLYRELTVTPPSIKTPGATQ